MIKKGLRMVKKNTYLLRLLFEQKIFVFEQKSNNVHFYGIRNLHYVVHIQLNSICLI